MSTSLVVGVLVTIGVIALLVVAGLLSSGGRSQATEQPLPARPAVREERVNGARHLDNEQTSLAALEYPRLSSPREQEVRTMERGRAQTQQLQQAQDSQQELQARYERTLQELVTLLQQEQRHSGTTVSMDALDNDDPYRAPVPPPRQAEDAVPMPELEVVPASSRPVQQPAVAHYSLVASDEEAEKKLPQGLSIPITVALDGNINLERIPNMRIEVVIHVQ